MADVATNVERIQQLYKQAVEQDVSLVTFPELSVTGYSLGDLVNQQRLLAQAKEGLGTLAKNTGGKHTAMVVGLPLQVGNRLYNCAAVLASGKIQGIVPKSNLPNYNEFYEQRWYSEWDQPNTKIAIGDEENIPFGTDMLFDVGDTLCGVEICEDLWVFQPPSTTLASKGALVIVNPSASPEQVDKADYRRNMVASQSGRLMGAYLYAGSHPTESTADTVMGGHQMIATNGKIVAERQPFGSEPLTIAEIDTDHLSHDRRKQKAASILGTLIVRTGVERQQTTLLHKPNKSYFLPEESPERRSKRLEEALTIEAHGLAMRMRPISLKHIVLGLSGGLDSTLALLVAMRAARILGCDPSEMIEAVIMPGPASSEGTQSNAQDLAERLGIPYKIMPISKLTDLTLETIGHDGTTQDVTYENTQARARTDLLFNYGNYTDAINLGTGDLSETAVGWCTYNADQQSHYHINVSIPKTMIRPMIMHEATKPEFAKARKNLDIVVSQVVSPELTKTEGSGITQSTDDLIGPEELRDFFLPYVIRWGDPAAKIKYLASQAFAGTYESDAIGAWFKKFISMFWQAQKKRQNMPDGPKVGSVSLSPRGDWRMPPDLYNAAIWE